jgi:hypothetical protein
LQRFLVRREPAGRPLGEAELAVHGDLEHATARFAQGDLRVGTGFDDQIADPTGAWFIASLTAIFDFDLHACGSPVWWTPPAAWQIGAAEGKR